MIVPNIKHLSKKYNKKPFLKYSEDEGNKHETLTQCWIEVGVSLVDGGPTLPQDWLNVPCLLASAS